MTKFSIVKTRRSQIRRDSLSLGQQSRFAGLERLEERRLLTYTFSIVGNVATVTSDGNFYPLEIVASNGLLEHMTDGNNSPTPSDYSSDWGGSTLAASATSTINIVNSNSANSVSVVLGSSTGSLGINPAQDIQALINLPEDGSSDSLEINNSASTADATGPNAYSIDHATITNAMGINVHFTGGPGTSILVDGGTGSSTFNINDPNSAVTIHSKHLTGSATSSDNIISTVNAVTVFTQGSDVVTVSNPGVPGNIGGTIGVFEAGGDHPSLILDDRGDTTSHPAIQLSADLYGDSTLTGLAANPIQFSNQAINTFTFEAGSGLDAMRVIFAQNNPLPLSVNGGSFNFVGTTGSTDILSLSGVPGGSFQSEVVAATGPGSGSIDFGANNSLIRFLGLSAINDVLPIATATLTMPTTGDPTINASNGPIFDGLQTIAIADGTPSNPPLFAPISFANKTALTLNAGLTSASDERVNLDNSLPAVGVNGVTVNLGNGPGNTVNALLSGVAAGTTLTVNGGSSGSTAINLDATGQSSTASPGLIRFAPSNKQLAFSSVQQVSITNLNEQTLTPVVATIQAAVGVPLVGVLAGSFTYSDPNASASDFVATLDWGDGSGSTPAQVVANGSGQFDVLGSHTYFDRNFVGRLLLVESVTHLGSVGTTTVGGVNVTTSDIGGASGLAQGSVFVTDPPVVAGAVPAISQVQEGSPLTNVAVATFTDQDLLLVPGSFTATINWGDGTPVTVGAIDRPGGPGTPFVVTGSHTYVNSGVNGGLGQFNVTTTVVDPRGLNVSVGNIATVADRPLQLSAYLNPASDSGPSFYDGITNLAMPSFFGFSEPGSHVAIYALPIGGGPTALIAQGITSAGGVWDVNSFLKLADGRYHFAEIVADAADQTVGIGPVTTVVGVSTFVIDTAGPKVASVALNASRTQVLVSYQADLAGLDPTTIADSQAYVLTKGSAAVKGLKVVGTSVIPATSVTQATVVVNGGKALPKGNYVFTVRSSKIRDLAGNTLAGDFQTTVGSRPRTPTPVVKLARLTTSSTLLGPSHIASKKR